MAHFREQPTLDPYLPAEHWQSAEDIQSTAAKLNAAAKKGAEDGIRVGYHNHQWELESIIDGQTALEYFAGLLDPEVILEVDTYWVAVGDQYPAALLQRLGDRVKFIHINDGPLTTDTKAQQPAAQGSIAIGEVIAAATSLEVGVVEFDDYSGDIFEGSPRVLPTSRRNRMCAHERGPGAGAGSRPRPGGHCGHRSGQHQQAGSSIWQFVAMFPPVPQQVIDAGYQDFADRWNPILDVFDECGVRFAHEVHPSEIAYDYWTTVRTLEAIGHREAFGLNWDPSHFMWQGIDPVSFIWDFKDRIYHVDCKDTKLRPTGRNTVMGSHLPWGDPRRGWDFVSAGRGDVPWESSFRALTAIGYDGPISVEREDAGMDRLHGAPEALAALKRFDFPVSNTSFDAAFSAKDPAEKRQW